ncbi:D-aminoacyl-tRNA deacylase [Gleimia sp. 6138-11-ORH1]|uniref:D-aminoacyl-tRNA deacylase n=1 Tax=Gleimia sp. 6138-11-ORH1 TaxID=2973937 RepID=UPI002169776D|nr:D-aminoacyl-tRNA deacylase [Gleimia sp. 6138-11-ORH1]MCS4484688.1 D-aminoacyl-tRNA deacylase [Gleimia sp. 6138-11-ORH1]
MRALIQRVKGASVTVSGQVVGQIEGPGLCVLLGVTHSDGLPQVKKIAGKIANLRIMADEKSVLEVAGSVLVVSQFTLYGDTRKGRRPSWVAAAPGEVAEPLVNAVVEQLRSVYGLTVATGVFGAQMEVAVTNDGPVTVSVEA